MLRAAGAGDVCCVLCGAWWCIVLCGVCCAMCVLCDVCVLCVLLLVLVLVLVMCDV